MELYLKIGKAYEKLKGKYRFHFSKDKALIAFKDGAHGKLTIRELATILFNGNGHIPARSAFADYIDDTIKNRQAWLYAVFSRHISFRKVTSTSPSYLADVYIDLDADGLGNEILLDVQRWIASGQYYKSHVPNAPSTIRKKGHDIPLVDKGALLNALYSQTKRST